MKYLIVAWNSENKWWNVLHYSHQYNDAKTWYEHFKKQYKDVKIMCDAFVMKEEETKREFLEFLKNIGKK